MDSQQLKALTDTYIMDTYARFDVALDRGEGATLYSPEGRAYVDFTSGIGVNSVDTAIRPGPRPFSIRPCGSSTSPTCSTRSPRPGWPRSW